MRIKLVIAEGLRREALLALTKAGFVREGPDEAAPTGDSFEVPGTLLEKDLPLLQDIGGVLDWTVLPEEAATPAKVWPWSQNPETD